jgi:pyridinium-3,5-biscarboxylic acid mononucleotide sulfurtransferase
MSIHSGVAVPPRTSVEVVARIATGGPALVALSGGVDSSLVASLAVEALGEEAVAATVSNPAVARREVAAAAELARRIGLRHIVIPADPLNRPQYRENGADRCYHCRTVETTALRAYGDAGEIQQYLDGIHLDDLSDDRPGLRAMDAAGFFHPLLWAGWRKQDVREVARARGLATWDRPSDACLASRIARGQPVSAELLDRIESAETVLHDRGFRRVRVRVNGTAARVEVDPGEVERLRTEPLSTEVIDRIRGLGFGSVTLDPRGYPAARDALPVLR